MAVRIRLSRHGRLHRPFFRIVAIDKRCHREGVANEVLGVYDPTLPEKNIQIDMAKVQAWIGRGATVSDGLKSLFRFAGYKLPTANAAVAAAKPKAKTEKKKAEPKKTAAKTFVPASRRAVRKHQAKVKAERKIVTEKAKAEHAAAKAAKAAPAAETPAS